MKVTVCVQMKFHESSPFPRSVVKCQLNGLWTPPVTSPWSFSTIILPLRPNPVACFYWHSSKSKNQLSICLKSKFINCISPKFFPAPSVELGHGGQTGNSMKWIRVSHPLGARAVCDADSVLHRFQWSAHLRQQQTQKSCEVPKLAMSHTKETRKPESELMLTAVVPKSSSLPIHIKCWWSNSDARLSRTEFNSREMYPASLCITSSVSG